MLALSNQLKKNRSLRRGLAFVWHTIGIILTYFIAFWFRFDFSIPEDRMTTCLETVPFAVLAYLLIIVIFRLYQGLWAYFTFRDCLVTASSFLFGLVLTVVFIYGVKGFNLLDYPRTVPLIHYVLLIGWEVGGRGFVRLIREWRAERKGTESGERSYDSRDRNREKRVIIVGLAEESDNILRSLSRQKNDVGSVVAIINDEKHQGGSKLRGVPIYYDLNKLAEFVRKFDASVVLVVPPYSSPARLKKMVDLLSKEKVSCDFRVIPSFDDIAAGRIDTAGIRRVEIEDLLERPPYQVDYEKLSAFVRDRVVMVTGAGGSIGSEICRQLIRLGPVKLILFEISEYLLFQVERELIKLKEDQGLNVDLIAIAGDVCNEGQILDAFHKAEKTVDVIFHAAAYKHVDLMERNSAACFYNNVIGTDTIARIGESEGVGDIVLISSDKAVRPTSLMGASKRLAERRIMERPEGKTRFKAVRFGNVLGSSGSVVPIFREQIASGGPVTVTSREVTRFFMTIPEAVELVLAAGSQKVDRRVFVLEMGDPVKIDTLARRMIELSGFIPDVDIPIIYTGLKPGEKEYEELLTDDEDVELTEMDRIWVVKKNRSSDSDSVSLDRLSTLIDQGEPESLREYAHSLIPGSKLIL